MLYFCNHNNEGYYPLVMAKDPVVQLVRMPPCHGGGRGFESRPDRDYFTKVAQNAVKHRFYGIFLFMLISKSNKFAHIFSDLFSDLFRFQK